MLMPFVTSLTHFLGSSIIQMRVELFLMLQLILFHFFPVHRFVSVEDYMVHVVRPGQRHFVAKERI